MPDGGRHRRDLERREDEVHRLADQRRRARTSTGADEQRDLQAGRRTRPPSRTPSCSCSASWTATRCSARLPIVGMRTTPTKNGVRPNVSMNGSMAPTRISDSTARRAAAAERGRRSATLPRPARARRGPAGSPWPPSVSLRVRELVDEREDVADDQEEGHEDRLLGDAARRSLAVVNAKTAGTNSPIAASTSSAAFEPAISRHRTSGVPWRSPPMRTLAPRTSSRLPMIEPVSEALTTSIRPAWRAKNAMMSSAMLPNVALRMPPTCGPGDRAEALGRQADDPGEAEDPRARDDEDDRRLDVEHEVQHDRHDARERRRRTCTRARWATAGPGSAGARRRRGAVGHGRI